MSDIIMTDIQHLLQQAETHRKQQRFDEAIELYSIAWSNHRQEMNKWEMWGYAFSLRRTNRPAEALNICRYVYNELDRDFKHNNDLYGWCIYDTEIKGRSVDNIRDNEQSFFKAVDAIAKLTYQDQYSPYQWAVLSLLKYLNKKENFPAEQILQWTNRLDPRQLSLECKPYVDENGKTQEYASDRENWYAWRTKALEKQKHYEECIELCEAALVELPSFHYGNDVWFTWRIAKSLMGLGHKAEASEKFQAVLKSKKEWFVQQELAQLLFEEGEIDAALDYAIEAALNHGELKNKYKLFLLMGKIFEKLGDSENAKKHIELAAAAWSELPGNKLPSDLNTMMTRFGISISDGNASQELLNALRPYWRQRKLSSLPKHTGTIKTILPHGKAGFVTSDSGKDYYFQLSSFEGSRKRVQSGLRVEFYVQRSFDHKKQQDSEEAVHLREIPS